MAGWLGLWGQPTGPPAVVQTYICRYGLMQLALSCAAAMLLPVLLYRLHLRRRRGSGSTTYLGALMQGSLDSGHPWVYHGPGLHPCPAQESAAVAQGVGEVAKQLSPYLACLLGDTAAKQLLHNLAVAQAQQDATREVIPVPYAGVTTLVPVSIKVDAPHERVHDIGPALLHTLSTTLDSSAAQECSGGAMFLGAAAVFQGCVQLLATVFKLVQPPVDAAAEDGATADPAPQLAPEQAQQVLQDTLQALQVAGSPVHQAAVCVQGHVAVQGCDSSSVGSTQQATVPQVTLVCLDPPCAAEGRAGALDIYLQPSSSSITSSSSKPGKGGSSARGRLVVCSAAGLLVDVANVPVTDSIRLDLPGLLAGVYHVALLPAAPSNPRHGMAAACRPLFTHPLLVLPPTAAAELHRYWRRAVSTAAVKGTNASQGGATSLHGGNPQPYGALQHEWDAQLSGLVCDLAAVMLYAAAGQAPQQQQLSSTGALLKPAKLNVGAFGHVLQNLLAHLCAQRLWELAAVATAAGQAVEAVIEADPQQAQEPASPTPGLATGGMALSSSHAADASGPPVTAAGTSLASSSGASRAADAATGESMSTHGSTSSASSSRACARSSQGVQPQGAAGELAAAGTWAGTWRHLASGFADARLEAGYLEYVYDTTLPADMVAAPFFMVVAACHGVLTDPFTTDVPMWQQVVFRLLFVALFGVPSALLMVNRGSLRQRGRRERARQLVDAGLALAAYVVILGRLYSLPTMARLLDNHWRSWAILVVGQGAFTMCCRQTRTRTWLPVTAWDYLGWFTAAVLVQGRVLPAALRSACVAVAALACSVVMEVRSRRGFLKLLLQVGGAAAPAAAAKGQGAYGKRHVD